MKQWKLQADAHIVELMYYKNSNIRGACSQVQHKYKRTQEYYYVGIGIVLYLRFSEVLMVGLGVVE